MAATNPTTKNIPIPEVNTLPGSCEIYVLVHDMECLLSILQTINEVDDPLRKSFLVDAAENIGSRMLEKLETRETFEDEECGREAAGEAS